MSDKTEKPSSPKPGATGQRVTINLTSRGLAARDELAQRLECNDTDAVNRGLRFAVDVLQILNAGGTLTDKDGRQIVFIIL